MQVIGGLKEMKLRQIERPQTKDQVERFKEVLERFPNAVAVIVADEHTGQRFGRAKRRAGMCIKLGGARQPQYYQCWATWAPRDLEKIG